MKKIVSFVALCLVVMPAFAATSRGGRSVAAQMAQSRRGVGMVNTAPMAVAPVNAPAVVTDVAPVETTAGGAPVAALPPQKPMAPVVDNRDKEREACINNNIGIGNTFVWASRYSNTADYAQMVEDVENPDNNICFVKVEVKSSDPRVSTHDVPSKYFEMGRDITCGDWTNEEMLKQRILDAKKTARTWGTVGGAVGGAGLGVGIMEWFGNDLIGGAVIGQEALSGNELLKSQLLVLKDKNITQYNDFVNTACEFIEACNDPVWNEAGVSRPAECNGNADNYQRLMGMIGHSCN